MARTGRRPGPGTSRGAILDAARTCFAQAGYEGASIRAIAADAGVDPAVVLHFFGSKHGLFTAAVGWPFDPTVVAAELAAVGTERLATRLARVFLGFWEDPRTRGPLLALLRSAMTHEPSARLLREFVVRELFASIASVVSGPDAQLRLELAAGHLIGLAVLRYALAVEPIASASVNELVRLLTPSLAPYLERVPDPPAA